MPALKIAFLSHTSKWAGAEACLFRLLRGLDPERHEPVVILPDNGPLQRRLEDLGVPIRFGSQVHWIGQAATNDWRRFGPGLTARVEATARLLERERCDLVFTNTSVVLEGALAARLTGMRHLWRVHEMLARHDNFRSCIPLALYPRLLAKLSDCVVAVSRSVAQAIGPDVDVDVVYNGVALHEPRRSRTEIIPEARSPLVVYVGTLSEAKGVHLLADVMARVVRRVPSAVCLLVGADAGAEAALKSAIAAQDLGSSFRFLGFRDDARDIIATADVLILPSRVDSLPNAVLEAMAAAVVPVATRSGGAEELIVDGETGRLVPVDDVAAMAAAVGELLTSPTLRRAMGEKALERAKERFSEHDYVAGLARRLDALVATPPRTVARTDLQRLLGLLEASAPLDRGRDAELRAALDEL